MNWDDIGKPDTKLIKQILKRCNRSHKYVDKVLRSMHTNDKGSDIVSRAEWVADLINQANTDDPSKVNEFYMDINYIDPNHSR